MVRWGQKQPEPEPEPHRDHTCDVCGSAEWLTYYVCGKWLCERCHGTMRRALPKDATRAMRQAYLDGLVQRWTMRAA